ncbi:MAG: polysaccharide biosynthesis protein, partial [Gammaproteobacteria bacterium]|nr:polysaccharide biosynthesis protein [Gammaproteobacteria bacterium]
EKLYEELLIGNNQLPTQHPRIMKAHEAFISWGELQPQLHTLQIASENNDVEMIRSLLQRLVDGYQPDSQIVDWVYREQLATSRD